MLKHVFKSLAILLIVPMLVLSGCKSNNAKQAKTTEKTETSDSTEQTEETSETITIDQIAQEHLTVTHEISENTPEKVTVKFDVACSANVENPHYTIQLVDENDEPVVDIAFAGETSMEQVLEPVEEETTYKVRIIVTSEDGETKSDTFETDPLVIAPAGDAEPKADETAAFTMSCVSDETVKVGINPNAEGSEQPYFHVHMSGNELTSLQASIGKNPGGCVVEVGEATLMIEATAGENGDCKLTISDIEKKDEVSIEINADGVGTLLAYKTESQNKTLTCSTENTDMLTALCP